MTINAVGGSIEYPVAAMKLSDYTLDDLISKNLLFLFPFYIFNLEKELRTFEKTESRTKVISSFTELLEYVNELYNTERLTCDKYLLITDMIQKVADNLSMKYNNVRKELDEIMGGKILEFRGEKIFNEGIEKGKVDELLGLAYDGTLPVDVAAKRAETKYKVSKKDFMKMLSSYKPEYSSEPTVSSRWSHTEPFPLKHQLNLLFQYS